MRDEYRRRISDRLRVQALPRLASAMLFTVLLMAATASPGWSVSPTLEPSKGSAIRASALADLDGGGDASMHMAAAILINRNRTRLGTSRDGTMSEQKTVMAIVIGDAPFDIEATAARLGDGERSFERVGGDGPDVGLFERDGLQTAALVFAQPMPLDELTPAAQQSLTFPEAGATASRHRAHVVVATSGVADGFEAQRRAALATSEVARAFAGTAVYWPAAAQVTAADRFDAVIAQSIAQPILWPAEAWVGPKFFGDATDAGQAVGARSQGLAPFLGTEIAFPAAVGADPGQLWTRVLATSTWLLGTGPILEDGHTVELPTGETLVARRAPGTGGAPDHLVLSPKPPAD